MDRRPCAEHRSRFAVASMVVNSNQPGRGKLESNAPVITDYPGLPAYYGASPGRAGVTGLTCEARMVNVANNSTDKSRLRRSAAPRLFPHMRRPSEFSRRRYQSAIHGTPFSVSNRASTYRPR
jgi:hypothetical protein